MATRANAAVNVCDGTRLRPENIQAAYAGSEENREPLSLTTVEQDASTSWNRRDGKCLLSGSLPGEPKGYFRETPVRHSSANLAGASFSPRFAPAIFVPGGRPSLALTAYRRGFRLSLVSTGSAHLAGTTALPLLRTYGSAEARYRTLLAGIAHTMMVAANPGLVLSSVKRCGEGLGVDPNKTSWCSVRLMGSPEFTRRVPRSSSRTEIETALPKPSRLDRAKPCPTRLVPPLIERFPWE